MPRERFKSFEELGHVEQSRRRKAAAQRMGAPLRPYSGGGKLVVHAEVAAHADSAVVHQCRAIALEHMQERLESKLPRRASRHRSFSHRSGEEACRAVRVRSGLGDHWAAQLERSPGAGQTIVTEVAVAHSEGRSPTITIEVVDRSVVPAEAMREYPAEMLATMAERMPLLQHGRRLSHEPIVVETVETMASFQQMLLDPGRRMPLAVLSVPPEPESPDQLRRQWEALARTLTGLAIVWVLPPAMTYRLSDLVSKNLSVFLGAWRYYRPGFSHRSPWTDHPLFLMNRMADDRGGRGRDGAIPADGGRGPAACRTPGSRRPGIRTPRLPGRSNRTRSRPAFRNSAQIDLEDSRGPGACGVRDRSDRQNRRRPVADGRWPGHGFPRRRRRERIDSGPSRGVGARRGRRTGSHADRGIPGGCPPAPPQAESRNDQGTDTREPLRTSQAKGRGR